MKLLLILLLSFPLITWAVHPNTLPYQAQVMVRTQESKELNQAFEQALHQVLIKLTGAAHQIKTKEAKQQIGLAERYVEGYHYLNPNTMGQFPLVVDFDPEAIDGLIKTLNLTVWTAEKPVVLSWIWTSPDEIQWVITPEDRPSEAEVLKNQADALGLPIIFPLMDVEDRRLLTPESLANIEASVLQAVMDRYGIDVILIGQVQSTVKTEQIEVAAKPTPDAPVSPEKAAVNPLAQAAQVRTPTSPPVMADPAMSNLPPSHSITPVSHEKTEPSPPPIPHKITRKREQWTGDWQLYTRKNTVQSNRWQSKSEKGLNDIFASGLGMTLQHLAQQHANPSANPVVDAAPIAPVDPHAPTQTVKIVVTGIQHLQDYIAVKNYLASLALVRAVNVHTMTPEEVTYELVLMGDEMALQTAIGNGRTLAGDSILPGVNFYRYQRP
ncbi:DUF2066 domain-containing protein [Thioflexithrix psekupsensis]|uniref:DUF2066 domain-containing protein n=1 Tax=Thioflexithrix psekupsensis TaxID=1570016 RepID=A0A251XC31_9GAMM|nr:DUF2066 domain-containing protein [Thioflexithrix psekupsensis]OUD15465.1 hypothetical protein TPSD3_02765 [Thioflexithrix psekupsensis]